MKTKPSKKHSTLLQNANKRIIRLVGDTNYTVFYLNEGKTVIMSYSLKRYQDHFEYPFVRVSKSCIVNLLFFENLCTENKKIHLKDGSEIQISRRRFEEVCKNISIQ